MTVRTSVTPMLVSPNKVSCIDHKSDNVDDFNSYQEQLDAYISHLVKSGENVLGVGINWVIKGQITFCSS